MRTSLYALAACCAIATGASAQTSVTLYGVVDIGIARESGGAGGVVTKLDGSGMHSGNRWGVRGTEDLGGGLSAIFVLENGFNLDTGATAQGGLGFGRQSFVGLKGGFGTVTAGRQYTPHWAAVDSLDPLDGITGGSFNLLRRTVRTDNTVLYSSPDLAGFTGQLAYGFGEVANNSSASRVWGASLGYARGPVLVKAAHHNGRNAADTDSTRNNFLGGRFDFGVARAFAGYQTERGTGTTHAASLLLGVQVPMGPHTLMASVIRKNDKAATNADARMLGLAYTYTLSRRTNFYASWVRIHNDVPLTYRTKAGDGSGDREINIGIRHRF